MYDGAVFEIKKGIPVREVQIHGRQTGFVPKLLVWAAVVVLAHFVIVIWHLILLAKVQPSTPRFALLLLVVINLLPVAALIVFVKGFRKLAGSMVIVPFVMALVIGGYTHFVSAGTDNVFSMPPGGLRLPFQISAVLLSVLEALGCWLGLQMLRVPEPIIRQAP